MAGSDKDRTSKRSGGAVVAARGAIVRQQNLRVILLAADKRAAGWSRTKVISPLESPPAKDARI